jgi:hypothetical protein
LNLLLFDVDGVLVYDRAYRAGVTAVLNYFGGLLGRARPVIDEAAIEAMHAHSYTNEWDMCPFGVGIMLIESLARVPGIRLAAAPPIEFLRQVQAAHPDRFPFEQYLNQTDQFTGNPAARALAVLLAASDRLIGNDHNRQLAQAFVRELLADPYNLARTITTQVFQEHVLGSTAYEETYGLPAHFDLPGLLHTEDRPALLPAGKCAIDALAQSGRAQVCVFTARPSLPPADVVDRSALRAAGYSPEAELALQLIDLQGYPLIAMGRMLWLSQHINRPVETLTKPAPVQALAAIAAAVTRHEAASLTAAYRLIAQSELTEPFASLRSEPLHVWVFEDARPGLQAARGAVELLCQHTIDAHFHGIGIASGGPKADALKSICDIILPDVNVAIEYVTRAITG